MAFNDFTHKADRFLKGQFGPALAYAVSAIPGAWLAYAFVSAVPPLSISIAAVLLTVSAIYLALNERNNIQKWLLLCLWRRVPVDKSRNEKDQVLFKEREVRDLPIWPTMEMEIEAFKIAIGLGE